MMYLQMMYLIDGNNVIGGRVGWHRDKVGSRRQLLRDLARLAHVKKTRLTVVLDGAPDHAFPDGSSYRGVRIFYSRQGSDADTRIIEMVEADHNKRNLIVVTSDRRLASRIRVCGVRVMRSGEFRQMLDEIVDPETDDKETHAEELETSDETSQWLRYFGMEEEDTAAGGNATRGD